MTMKRYQLICLYMFALGSLWTNFLPQVGFFAGFFVWLYDGWRRGFVWHPTAIDAPFLALGFITILTAFTGVDVMNSLGGLPKTLGWMGIYVWVVHVLDDSKDVKNLIRLLIFSAFTQSLYGLWTYGKGDPSRLESGGWEGWMRIYGTMSHPIFLGEGLAMMLALGVVWLLWSKDKFRWWIVPASLSMSWCLGLTYARGAWLGAVAAFGMLVRWSPKWYWVALAVLIVTAGYAVKTNPDHQVVKRLKSIGSTENETVKERLVMWKAGWNMIKDHPFGVGVHNSEQASKAAHPEHVEGYALLHSNLVQMVVERGVAGVLAFLWLSVALLWALTQRLKSNIDGPLEAAALGAAMAYMAFFVSGLTEYNFGTQRIVMLMWFVVGLGFASLRLNRLKSAIRNPQSPIS